MPPTTSWGPLRPRPNRGRPRQRSLPDRGGS
jgi:hypothetical protein